MTVAAISTGWSGVAPHLLSVLRITSALLLMQSGTAKWFAFPASLLPGGGTVTLGSLVGLAAILEAIGGFLLLTDFCVLKSCFWKVAK